MDRALALVRSSLILVFAIFVPVMWLVLFFNGNISEPTAWVAIIVGFGLVLGALVCGRGHRWLPFFMLVLLACGALSIFHGELTWLPHLIWMSLAFMLGFYMRDVPPTLPQRWLRSFILILIGLIPIIPLLAQHDLRIVALSWLYIAATLVTILAFTATGVSMWRISALFYTALHLIIRGAVLLFGASLLTPATRDFLIQNFAGFGAVMAGLVFLWGLAVSRPAAWGLIAQALVSLFMIEAVLYQDHLTVLLLSLFAVADFTLALTGSVEHEHFSLGDILDRGGLGSSLSFLLLLTCLEMAAKLGPGRAVFWFSTLLMSSTILWLRPSSRRLRASVTSKGWKGWVLHLAFYFVGVMMLAARTF